MKCKAAGLAQRPGRISVQSVLRSWKEIGFWNNSLTSYKTIVFQTLRQVQNASGNRLLLIICY